MRLAVRNLGSFSSMAFSPSTVIPGAGVTQASDSVTYQKTAIQQSFTQVAPLKTVSFKPVAAAAALPLVARSPFLMTEVVAQGAYRDAGYKAAGDVHPIEDATGVETAGREVALAHEESFTPEENAAALDERVTLIDDANQCSAPAPTTSWTPWVLGIGGVLVVGISAWFWGRRSRR